MRTVSNIFIRRTNDFRRIARRSCKTIHIALFVKVSNIIFRQFSIRPNSIGVRNLGYYNRIILTKVFIFIFVGIEIHTCNLLYPIREISLNKRTRIDTFLINGIYMLACFVNITDIIASCPHYNTPPHIGASSFRIGFYHNFREVGKFQGRVKHIHKTTSNANGIVSRKTNSLMLAVNKL